MSVDETKDCLFSSLSISSIDKLTYSGSGAKEMANNINALRQLFYRHMPYISGFTSMSKVHIYFYLQEVKDKIIIIRKFHLHMHCFLTYTQRSQVTKDPKSSGISTYTSPSKDTAALFQCIQHFLDGSSTAL